MHRARPCRCPSIPTLSPLSLAITGLQELVHNYNTRAVHRSDGSLLFYGFVAWQDHPLLCGVDLPAGQDPNSPDDSIYDSEPCSARAAALAMRGLAVQPPSPALVPHAHAQTQPAAL